MSVCTAWPAAWGDGHDAFKEVAKQVGEAYTPLLVVGVPISNSEHYKVNPLLAVGDCFCTDFVVRCVVNECSISL